MTRPGQSGSAGEFWVITSYFNPAGSRRRLLNYREFRRCLAVPLLTVELGFGAPPALAAADADILLHCRDGDVMWQKERLLNHALAHLPATCKQVAWIDCDLIFDTGDWVAQARAALAHSPLVQLFTTLRHAPADADPAALRDGVQGWSQPSVMASILSSGAPAEALGSVMNRGPASPSPGMAWAAGRELLQSQGFYDRCIVGGGDTAFACAALGCPEVAARLHQMNPHQLDTYLPWAEGLFRHVGGHVACLRGTVHHLWHGDLVHRQSSARHARLAPHQFDPRRDLALGRDGAWRWARGNAGLHAFVRGYFQERREDG
ncbi:MAG: hypothetical protein AB7P37_03990 [Ramlibacter sp.]